MYYRIYGVMSTTGFHTDLFQRNTAGKAREAIKEIDEKLYPFFAITEHKEKGMPAMSIAIGWTEERAPIMERGLVEYLKNPMLDAKTAQELFTTLDTIKQNREAAGASFGASNGGLHAKV